MIKGEIEVKSVKKERTKTKKKPMNKADKKAEKKGFKLSLFIVPNPGMITRVFLTATNCSLDTLNGFVLTIVVIPRAKNIPAKLTMNGWISKYATKNP